MPENLQYDIKESTRARNVTLKVNRSDGLVVVVPKHFDQDLLPDILSSRREWIDRQLQRFDRSPGRFDIDWPPSVIDMRALGLVVRVEYLEWARAGLKLRQCTDALQLLMPAHASDERVAELLRRWLMSVATREFVPLVQTLASAHGFEYGKVAIRGQKTRWGSFSSHGTLSLNYKLLFLPGSLLRYVILHELVHSVHMDHSSEFWGVLEHVDPDARRHDEQLANSWKYLPGWLD